MKKITPHLWFDTQAKEATAFYVSLFLNFDPSSDAKAKENLSKTWASLAEGGKVLMPLQEYPFRPLP